MIIVTGASGMLGHYVLKAAGPDAIGAYNTSKPSASVQGTSNLVQADISTQAGISKLMALKPEAVINCAALASADDCEVNQGLAKAVNTDAVGMLSKACRKSGCSLVHISTDFVFSGRQGMYKESDEPSPVNFYGWTKMMGEKQLHPEDLCVRTALFGWSHGKRQNIADWVVSSLRQGKEVPAFTNSFFTPIYAGDLARLLLEMLEKGYQGTYHAAGIERVSKHTFALKAAEAFGLDKSLVKQGDIKKWAKAAEKTGLKGHDSLDSNNQTAWANQDKRPEGNQAVGLEKRDASNRAERPMDSSLDCSKLSSSGIKLPTVREGLERMKADEDTTAKDKPA